MNIDPHKLLYHYVIFFVQHGTGSGVFKISGMIPMEMEHIEPILTAYADTHNWPPGMREAHIAQCPDRQSANELYDLMPGEKDSDEKNAEAVKLLRDRGLDYQSGRPQH